MAVIAVQLLLERLSSLIVEEAKLLGGVGGDVNEIKDDLESMRSFLQDAESRGETDQGVKTWVKQVRKVAYDTEDILDEFLLRLVPPHRHEIFDSVLHKLHYITHLKTRLRLANEIKNIKATLKAISERRNTFVFTDNGEGVTRANATSNAWYDPRIASLYIDEAEVVGIEGPKIKLIKWLTKGELKLTIISVVGMGGLGKTTLVKKVYDSQTMNKHFDCHVWITVSNSPVIREVMRTTIKEVLKVTKERVPKEMDAMDDNELIEVLKKLLWKKRYVIIFDDIWDIDVWEAMKFAFPDRNCGSRIIFTTRENNVACSKYVYNLELLKEPEAWELFCMKAFGSNHDSSNGCPQELEKLSRNILKKCGGLPLAIVLIGGVLGRKAKTVQEWKNIHDNVGAEMRINGGLESLGKILLLSYNSLPYYLKPCFLHLSMFPEDYFIKRMTLIRLWIAEGFIEDKQNLTMEVVAGDYINELISRSMIQIAELNKCNDVKSCRIHDLMREIIQSKSKEEFFSTTMTGSQGLVSFNESVSRRISIYHNSNTGDENYNSYPMGSRCSHIRSLMMFQLDETPHSFQRTFFRAFRLLRVLDLEGADLVEFPPELVELIHLRYLSLRGTNISVLPKSVRKLKNLETLDLKQTGVSELPVEILKLQRLRHLLVYRYGSDRAYGVSVPTWRIGNLTSLQKLAYLDVHHQAAAAAGDNGVVVMKELGKLTQLRKLGITNLRREDGRYLCLALEKMEHLSSLNIFVNKEEEFLELGLLKSPPPQLLRHLLLRGRLMRLPVWIASLKNLTSLTLRYSRLSCEQEDPLEAFQRIPNLMHLELTAAYDGEELCCNETGGYKNLKELLLLKMERLKRVRFMKGSMPMLRRLVIEICPALEMVPLGIEHLKGLQQLWLCEMHSGLVERIRKRRPRSPATRRAEAQREGEDCWRVQHIPKIIHAFRNTEGTLVTDKL